MASEAWRGILALVEDGDEILERQLEGGERLLRLQDSLVPGIESFDTAGTGLPTTGPRLARATLPLDCVGEGEDLNGGSHGIGP